MRTKIAERTAAGELALETPGERHIGIADRVHHELPGERPELAEDALGDKPASLGDGRVSQVVEANQRLDISASRRFVHGASIGRGEGERLLAVHVLAGLDRGHRDLFVQPVGCDDVYHRHLRVGDRFAPVDGVALVAQ